MSGRELAIAGAGAAEVATFFGAGAATTGIGALAIIAGYAITHPNETRAVFDYLLTPQIPQPKAKTTSEFAGLKFGFVSPFNTDKISGLDRFHKIVATGATLSGLVAATSVAAGNFGKCDLDSDRMKRNNPQRYRDVEKAVFDGLENTTTLPKPFLSELISGIGMRIGIIRGATRGATPHVPLDLAGSTKGAGQVFNALNSSQTGPIHKNWVCSHERGGRIDIFQLNQPKTLDPNQMIVNEVIGDIRGSRVYVELEGQLQKQYPDSLNLMQTLVQEVTETMVRAIMEYGDPEQCLAPNSDRSHLGRSHTEIVNGIKAMIKKITGKELT
jgi:hypothetical protein